MSSLKICPQCGTEYELDQRFCPTDGTTLRLQNETGDLVGAIVADRYHVLRKLGEGGMGQVYLAEHVKMGRKSALKVMNPAMVKDADAVSRFNREASNASRINHPNVADVYDFGETPEGVIYLAMEFVDGPPLTKLIEEQGALPPRRVAAIVRQAADGLSVAHDMGIVHRDLKPDNIMIARNRDGSDCVKIVDFGIAKAADNAAQKVTKTGLVVGTPEYMSPEQLAGDKLDGRSDIYALALVAFNLLTGRLPFPAETVQESMIMRLTDRPKRLAEMRPDLAWPDALQAVLDRALERDAARRYQTASEFGRDFQHAVEQMTSAGAAAATGTQSMAAPPAAIPPTRVGVGGAPASVSPARASAVAAPTVPSAAAPASPSRRRAPMLAAVGVIAIAAAATGFVMLRNGGHAAANPVTLDKALQSEQGSATPQPPGSGSEQSPGAAGTPTSTIPVSRPTTSGTRVQNVTAVLDSIEQLTDPLHNADSATASRALRRLDALSAFGSDDDRIRATILRAEAEMLVGRQRDACRLLRAVRGEAHGTNQERVVTLLGTCP